MLENAFKGNFGYCPRASFLRREMGKVFWVPSFDDFQIRFNTGFRYVYVWWMFPHFLAKKVTKTCLKHLLTHYYKWSSQLQTLIKIDLAYSLQYTILSSSIPARSHTFVEIDHEIISTVILLPSAESFKKGCCQLQAKICARSTG